ncbi:M48 family metalloprotease, partial [Oleiphilus sp. HI0067]
MQRSIFFAAILFSLSVQANESELPSFGNASSTIISIEQERELGTAWLSALRGQVRTYEQPSVEEYLEQLVYSLAPNSTVADKSFRFVILNSPELNAFAVPGSVIGINAGLFLHAANEQEFASVLAHELAHLSQRHYARRLQKQELSTPL